MKAAADIGEEWGKEGMEDTRTAEGRKAAAEVKGHDEDGDNKVY